jgi:hypothetical protein
MTLLAALSLQVISDNMLSSFIKKINVFARNERLFNRKEHARIQRNFLSLIKHKWDYVPRAGQ